MGRVKIGADPMTDILKKLRGYNPPDRTIEEDVSISEDIQEAANEIYRLRVALDYAYRIVNTGFEYGKFDMSVLRQYASDWAQANVEI
jgi:hypothetical protein